MRTPRLPLVDWTDSPADLNWLVRFAERRNLVSVRVPSHFKLASANVSEHPMVTTFKGQARKSWPLMMRTIGRPERPVTSYAA